MILTDGGPLVAILNANDTYHAVCTAEVPRFGGKPFLTTWPAVTEAMHFLGREGGYDLQAKLWGLYSSGLLQIYELTEADTERMIALMDRYRNFPMDLADASLVAAAEATGRRKIFTVDEHFHSYELADGSYLNPVPRINRRPPAPPG